MRRRQLPPPREHTTPTAAHVCAAEAPRRDSTGASDTHAIDSSATDHAAVERIAVAQPATAAAPRAHHADCCPRVLAVEAPRRDSTGASGTHAIDSSAIDHAAVERIAVAQSATAAAPRAHHADCSPCVLAVEAPRRGITGAADMQAIDLSTIDHAAIERTAVAPPATAAAPRAHHANCCPRVLAVEVPRRDITGASDTQAIDLSAIDHAAIERTAVAPPATAAAPRAHHANCCPRVLAVEAPRRDITGASDTQAIDLSAIDHAAVERIAVAPPAAAAAPRAHHADCCPRVLAVEAPRRGLTGASDTQAIDLSAVDHAAVERISVAPPATAAAPRAHHADCCPRVLAVEAPRRGLTGASDTQAIDLSAVDHAAVERISVAPPATAAAPRAHHADCCPRVLAVEAPRRGLTGASDTQAIDLSAVDHAAVERISVAPPATAAAPRAHHADCCPRVLAVEAPRRDITGASDTQAIDLSAFGHAAVVRIAAGPASTAAASRAHRDSCWPCVLAAEATRRDVTGSSDTQAIDLSAIEDAAVESIAVAPLPTAAASRAHYDKCCSHGLAVERPRRDITDSSDTQAIDLSPIDDAAVERIVSALPPTDAIKSAQRRLQHACARR